MKTRQGFTVIEVIVVVIFLVIALGLFIAQKTSVDAAIRDTERKTAVNAMYYSLEEVYYEKAGYYPQELAPDTLTAIDPELMSDPEGYEIGDGNSSIQYESNGCSLDGKCTGYTLRAQLEREGEYVKTQRERD